MPLTVNQLNGTAVLSGVLMVDVSPAAVVAAVTPCDP